MVSTRQSSNVGGNGDHSNNDSGGIKTRHSSAAAHHSNCTEIVPSTPQPSSSQGPAYVSKVHFLDLPQEIFDKIFSYVGYKTVSQLRLVSLTIFMSFSIFHVNFIHFKIIFLSVPMQSFNCETYNIKLNL